MNTRKRILILSSGFVLAVVLAWMFVQFVYWPKVTAPSTVTAAEAGNLELLKNLDRKGMSLDLQDKRKFMWTPLIAATYSGNTNVMDYLLSRGVNIELQDLNGKTALMWAVERAYNDYDLTAVRMLIEGVAKVFATITGRVECDQNCRVWHCR